MEESKKRQLENRLREMLDNELQIKEQPPVIQTSGASGNVIRRRKGEQDKRIAN